jgi:hypothetical protein
MPVCRHVNAAGPPSEFVQPNRAAAIAAKRKGMTMTNEDNKPVEVQEEISTSRRRALFKIGLAGLAIYTAPALLSLSEAQADDRKSKKSKKSKKSNKSRKSKKSRDRKSRDKKSKKSKNSRGSRNNRNNRNNRNSRNSRSSRGNRGNRNGGRGNRGNGSRSRD